MKPFVCLLALILILSGCRSENDNISEGLALREKLMKGNGCEFQTEIIADFGELKHSFTLQCQVDPDGLLAFAVVSPESIAGISGSMDHNSGRLTFDKTVLAFPPLAEGMISPVSGPWLFYKALCGGYLRAAGRECDKIRLSIDDSFQGDNLTVEMWLDNQLPVCAEIIWQGSNVLTLLISDFRIL